MKSSLLLVPESQMDNNSWVPLEKEASISIASSSTLVRGTILKKISLLLDLNQVANTPDEEKAVREVARLVLNTYNNYQDPHSRAAVLAVLQAYVKYDVKYLLFFAQYIYHIAAKCLNSAITDALSLLAWVNSLLPFASNTASNPATKYLVEAQLCLLFLASNGSSDETAVHGPSHRRRIHKSCVAQTKRAISNKLLQAQDQATAVLLFKDLLTTPLEFKLASASAALGYIAILIDAAYDLLPSHPFIYDSLESDRKLQASLLDYFVKSCLLAKSAPTLFSISAFARSYMARFVSVTTFASDVLPNLEKAIVRSSEVGLCNIAPYLFDSKDCIDISQAFAKSKLLGHTLSGLKSPKEWVRQLAFKTLVNIFQNSIPFVTSEDVAFLVDEILKTFKSTANTESRVLLVKVIGELRLSEESLSAHVLNVLLPLVAKESNEQLLTELVSIFGRAFLHTLTQGWAYQEKIEALLFLGFNNAKLSLKSIWTTVLGKQLLDSFDSTAPALSLLLERLQPSLVTAVNEAIKAPLPTVANKGISAAYVCISLSPFFASFEEFELVISTSLDSTDHRISILTSIKVVSKLLPQEQLWCVRALRAAFSSVRDFASFASVYVYFCSANAVDHATKTEALEGLNAILANREASNALTEIVVAIGLGEKNIIEAVSAYGSMSSILSQLSSIGDRETRIQNVIKLLVVSHLPQFRIKERWIGLLLRSGLDPNELLVAQPQALFDQAYSVILAAPIDSALSSAAASAIKSLCLINANVMQPIVASALTFDLLVESLEYLDQTAIQIWKANDGELVLDVLKATPAKKVDDKNSPDYETRKWEESLKKELVAKNNTAKKLTRQEQILVAGQLAVEKRTREKVTALVKRFSRAFTLISALSTRNPLISEGGLEWFSAAVFLMLSVMRSPLSGHLFDETAARTFIGASQVCFRLEPLSQLAGAATLRALEIQGVPETFCQIPLNDAISRVLFRAKMMVDDWYDEEVFIYMAPLVTKVLQTGLDVVIKNSKKQVVTSEFVEEDPEEEHLSLAISILCAQDMLLNGLISREPILEALIGLMRVSSKAKMAKECFLTLCQQLSGNVFLEDLNLLLRNVITSDVFVKTAILKGLDTEFDLSDYLAYADQIWIAMHDTDSVVAETAQTIWQENSFKLPRESLTSLLKYIDQSDSGLRLTVARALADAAATLQSSDSTVFGLFLETLLALFVERQTPSTPPKDKFGLVINTHASQRDQWEARSTLAILLGLMSSLCQTQEDIHRIFEFLVTDGALGDKEPLVSQELLEAGVNIVRDCGAAFVETLVSVFEAALAAPDTNTRHQDRINELVIILYGALGRHLPAHDPRLPQIFDRLLTTLDTPSEDVQHAILEGLVPLVPAFQDVLQERFDALFDKLWNAKTLAARKGAAYGIAGLVKGAHILALYTYDVMRNLISASDDKKVESREGVAFLVDCLSQSLTSHFEPYVIELLPVILKSLGDSSPSVREATDLAARQIMKFATSYGVKQFIPLAIRNLDDMAWRTKKGSVELLGSMAYLDPTQLSASLSDIVPQIVGVLNDSHKEVRKASDQALKRFGEVIRNPEIQVIVPDLIRATADPTKHTDAALDKLIQTQFVHYIDGPSLALIIHVIHRGMKDRSAATKKKACKIVGNMAFLVDSRDLQPYLAALVAELEIAMVDPVPETRSTGARALGSLVEKLGEDQFPDMIPKLMHTLNDISKTGDRLGSAQALAEVICGLGLSKLDELLPEILACAQAPQAQVRAGFMPLLLYLPVCFGSQFSPYLSRIIPPILQGLADTDEEIRDTALRAGRLIVKNYAWKAVDLLLPELEHGLQDSSYRIRLSSAELTGDLLFQVMGISGKNELLDEEAEVSRSLVSVLGHERRDRILAALFVCRSDVASVVRAAAIDIWKALVANTPKTVREIIPSLAHVVVRRLASGDDVSRKIAAATLGDVVRRVGANALTQLLPSLEELLVSSDTDAKLGICIALAELITSASLDALASYRDRFVGIVRDALVDASPSVREAAARAFEALQNRVGKPVIDQVLPPLLAQLDTADSELALLALQQIMATQADAVFLILLPMLISPQTDVSKTKVLASLVAVAGPAFYSRLAPVINYLLQAIIDTERSGTEEEINIAKAAFDQALLSVDDDAGVHPVMRQLMSLVKNQDADKRAAIAGRLAVFFDQTNLDYSVYVQDLASQLIFSLGDKNPEVVTGMQAALAALVKAQDKQALERLVKPAHQALSIAGVRGDPLPGFELPRGPSCVLPIFYHGLMYGSSEQKVMSATSISEIIYRTPAVILKPFATPITGPLIRVIGERVSSDIKSAILDALVGLLRKIPQFLRPFIPQLQRTFVRSLADPTNDSLRSGAVTALGILVEFQPRLDSLVTELVGGARAAEDQKVRSSLLLAMSQVVLRGGANVSDASKIAIMTLIEEEISHVSDKSAVAYARLLGSIAQVLSSEEAANILKTKVLNKRQMDEELKFGILSVNSFLRDAPEHVFHTGFFLDIVDYVMFCANAPSAYISDNATVAMGKILLLHEESKSPYQKTESSERFEVSAKAQLLLLQTTCVNALQPTSNSSDTRRFALVVIRTIARKKHDSLVQSYLDTLTPTVFSCLRDPVVPIRLAAEKAFLALFRLVEDTEKKIFFEWFAKASKGPITNPVGNSIQPRSVGDYTKRVASRLASAESERLTAGGDDENLYSDRIEDEAEIWAVGGR